MHKIRVSKRNVNGEETWSYSGVITRQGDNYLVLEAFFDREDTWVEGMLLSRGDRFVETYYTDRWYNIFEIHAREDDLLRGWYCNIGRPANWDGKQISYIDLALDLLVFPDGRQVVLDEEEFDRLEIPDDWRQKALSALEELKENLPPIQAEKEG